jgi:hypothetical protein
MSLLFVAAYMPIKSKTKPHQIVQHLPYCPTRDEGPPGQWMYSLSTI